MSTLRGWLALMLLWVACATAADDFQLSTNPPPPWNTTEPVALTLTIQNTSNEARRYGIDFVGFGQPRGLVKSLNVVDESAVGPFEPVCSDIGPTLGLYLTNCLSTQPIPAGETRSFQFDVVAFPDALGFDEGKFEIRTFRSDFWGAGVPVAYTPSTLFAYGYTPHTAVPGLNLISIMVMGVLLAIIAAPHLRSFRES